LKKLLQNPSFLLWENKQFDELSDGMAELAKVSVINHKDQGSNTGKDRIFFSACV
jgi:hypothetical protein